MSRGHFFMLFGAQFFTLALHAATPYDSMTAKMQALSNAYPDLVTNIDIGKNDQGQTISGLRIELPTPSATNKAKHLVVGTHHGNEQLSADVAVRFAKDLTDVLRNPTAPLHGSLAANIYFVIPVLNISGYNAGRREERATGGELLDPNRDYPDPCASDRPFRLASTSRLSNFIDQEQIVGAVTIHGYIGTFTFPWGTFTDEAQTPDHADFLSLAHKSTTANHYRTGTHGEVIYPTAGAFEDWAYHQYGIWVMLLEIARAPNIATDAASLLTYFSLAPSVRSSMHEHLGHCIPQKGPIRARP